MGRTQNTAAALTALALMIVLPIAIPALAAPTKTADKTPATPLADAQKALQINYNDRDAAVSRKDVDGALAHYAPASRMTSKKSGRILSRRSPR